MRVSELITLTTGIHTGTNPYVECEGKGRKHRATSLNATIRDQLRAYLQERSTRPGTALFPRDTIEHRLAAHIRTANESCPSMTGKHISAHTLRHTTAMTCSGPASTSPSSPYGSGMKQTSTTDVYLHADTPLKKDALDKTRPPHVTPGMYSPQADILAWLETL